MKHFGPFYHGTSTSLEIDNLILPSIQTGILREDWRQKNLNKVYFTNSVISAKRYAKKACEKYGGDPIVYVVKPLGIWFHRIDKEYVADRALVIGTLDTTTTKHKIKYRDLNNDYLYFIFFIFFILYFTFH